MVKANRTTDPKVLTEAHDGYLLQTAAIFLHMRGLPHNYGGHGILDAGLLAQYKVDLFDAAVAD
jgi:hypothetical protein